MQFNPDHTKQAKKVIFSRKRSSSNLSHPPIQCNNNDITKCLYHKHLGIVSDSKLNFNAHVDHKIKKCNRIIGLIRRLSINIPRNVLLTILKSFTILKSCKTSSWLWWYFSMINQTKFSEQIRKSSYRACFAITGAIQGTSRTKLYDELGLHSLIKRRWCNKIIFFKKIVNGLLPDSSSFYIWISPLK